ncbi:MAG: response regulator [Phycisphaeraceae bacterium]|nr:response regulator [Phycisphaeraceae bacterium]
MSQRDDTLGGDGNDPVSSASSPASPAMVLVVEPEGAERDGVLRALRDPSMCCDTASNIAEAIVMLEREEYDAAIIPMTLEDGQGFDLVRLIESSAQHTKTIMLADRPLVSDAIDAMRSGAVDLLSIPIAEAELLAAVVCAVDKARHDRRRTEKTDHLKSLCKKLHSSQQKMAENVDSLSADLLSAYDGLEGASRSQEPATFEAQIAHDLDIESLLRKTLEHMLHLTGPTNAAVFLPCNHSDFNLGAYVNYDCPRDTVDVLLDQLADLMAPNLQHEDGIVSLSGDSEITSFLGDDAGWLSDYEVVAFSCRNDDECLAVITFFRELGRGFPRATLEELKSMGDLLAAQLARVVKIHHRHMPDHEWSGWFEEEDDEDFGWG